jgi:C4-dicarboxylate-specific signal transduction histidine kinase
VPVAVRIDGPLPAAPLHGPMVLQSLMALVTNGKQAVAERGFGEVRVLAAPGPGATLVVVEDDGPGLSIERPEDAFLPFFTTRADDGHLGIGLTVARHLLGKCGGDVEAEAAPRGARFVVRLPSRP